MEYKKRLIDKKIEKYLKIFGAISIEGPKWCGKTFTSEHFANHKVYFSDKNTKELAKTDFNYVLKDIYPTLIDEWQLIPSIWDEVRNRCDRFHVKGGYILTGSTTLNHNKETMNSEDEVFHSGAGRFALINMYPMSLFESGDSSGEISLTDMYNGIDISKRIEKSTLTKIARYIIRGGWPENIDVNVENQDIIPREYIKLILTKDIHEGKKRRDSDKMLKILKSLARNESTVANLTTIMKDITEENSEIIKDTETISDYITTLKDLYLIANIPAFNLNYRSSKRIGTSAKRHFVDPSIASSLLELSEEKLLYDFKTFGYLFESLVTRDLRIYIENLDGHIFHFRDNISGDEVDAILEFKGGEYAAIEIKLNNSSLDKAKNSLLKFYKNANKKPIFMAIIIAECEIVYKDKETGIYILPITALKP